MNFFQEHSNIDTSKIPYARFVAVLEGTYCTFHNEKTYQNLQYGIYRSLHNGIDFYLHRQRDYSRGRCTEKSAIVIK